MTYPGALPHGQQLGFNNQQSHHHQYAPGSLNTWPGQQAHGHTHAHMNGTQQQFQPQLQPQSQLQPHLQPQPQQLHYQNNVNVNFIPAPVYGHGASQQPQGRGHAQPVQQQHPQQHNYQTAQLQQQQRHHQHMPPSLQQQHPQQQPMTYQFHSYDPSFDQRPYAQTPPQNGAMHPSSHMIPSMPQPVQSSNHYIQPHPNPQQQQQQQTQHPVQSQPQQMEWEQMPPPVAVSSPMPPYQPAQSQSQSQSQSQHQHQNHVPQHVNSPITAPSPQFQQQQHRVNSPMSHSPHVTPRTVSNNQQRTASANARVDHASRVSASPRLTSQNVTRSPSVSSTRSPALTPALVPHHKDTASLLISVAEELFTKARKGARDVAAAGDEQSVHEYQKLIATGLGCLEVVIHSNKLTPRLEALARLRYASILCAETDNVMEAEMALTKGLTLCDRNRFGDLKYCMHFVQVQLLFSQHKEKAALIALDARIRDAEIFKHTYWVYAFRFLKACFYLQSSNPAEAHALENLRAIINLANQKGDHYVYALTSLLEAFSHLRTMKDDAIVRIQACIAQAAKYQLDDSKAILQLEVLQLVLDLACSLQQKSPQMISQKLKALQDKMDASIKNQSWGFQDRTLYLPIHKQANNRQVISPDTSGVLRLSKDGDPYDFLVLSFWSKLEAFTTTYTYSGLALLYQQPRSDKKLFSLWDEALSHLRKNRAKIRGWAYCLEDGLQHIDWEREAACYLHILRGLYLATSTKWEEVKECVAQLEAMVTSTSGAIVSLYSRYLLGVYHQGTGNLDAAISIYSHPSFSLDANGSRGVHRKPAESEVTLLASFNLIWIMQHPAHQDDQRTQELLEQIRPLCVDHPNMEIRTAYNLVMAAIQTTPRVPMTAVKTHISTALSNAKTLADVHTLSIALNLMRAKLFQNIVGDQALKSAKAASTQARRSGNTLWMSVADGMLSQSYEVQGATDEAQRVWQDATHFANQALRPNRG